ncbi:kinase-like domain-containing protein [Suillus subluteus]|nr:kinase-like domain-containing protein [Suillus subluteus]
MFTNQYLDARVSAWFHEGTCKSGASHISTVHAHSVLSYRLTLLYSQNSYQSPVLFSPCPPPLQRPAHTPRQSMTTTLVDNQAISRPTNLDDLTKFITKTSNYPVACGGSGSVYRWDYKCEDQLLQVAVKKFYRIDSEDREALRREIGVWKRLRHECIVPLLGYTRDDPSEPVSLVSLWMSKGTLHRYLDGKIRDDKYLLLYNVANGLHYLHSESVVHGDLTSMNVLIDEKGQACLADFGLSSMVKIGEDFEYLRPHVKQHGAFSWSAPELISFDGDEDEDGVVMSSLNHRRITERYMPSPSSDMYSYGCIMFEVLSGKVPKVTLRCAMEGKTPERPQAVRDEDWIFILQCWLSLPSLRPVASQALKFAGTLAHPSTPTESAETSSQASIYTAHLDDANVYNLSSLVPSHTQPAFLNPEACWKSVHKLAKALLDLFKKTIRGDQRLLNDAIQLYHVSLATLSPTPIPSSLHEVIAAIPQIGTGRRDDENSDAIERLRLRMESVDVSDPFHFTGSSYLSLVDIARHITDKSSNSISSAKIWYRKSFGDTISGVLCRLQIALACARIAEKVKGEDKFRLEAYEMSLQLLQSHISATPTLTWAVEHLSTSLAVDAAATALGIKQVNKAVELLEWGRELLWTYIARSRTTKKEEEQEEKKQKEQEKEKDQEEDGKKISKVEQLNLLVSGVLDTSQETSSHKSAVVPNAKVHEIREAEGTPRSHPQISDLLKATQDGPVVMLIASRRSCDAIIVSNAYPKPLHVQLEITFSCLAELSTTFQACTSSVSEDPDSIEDKLKEILCCLWYDVVVPVIASVERENSTGA